MTRVEEAGKKRADAQVNKLKSVDSWKAAKMMVSWLLNRDSPEYLKEAAISFVFEKY
jgi:hypothetical protein